MSVGLFWTGLKLYVHRCPDFVRHLRSQSHWWGAVPSSDSTCWRIKFRWKSSPESVQRLYKTYQAITFLPCIGNTLVSSPSIKVHWIVGRQLKALPRATQQKVISRWVCLCPLLIQELHSQGDSVNAVKALTACLLFSSCEENGVSSPPSCGKHNLPGCDSCVLPMVVVTACMLRIRNHCYWHSTAAFHLSCMSFILCSNWRNQFWLWSLKKTLKYGLETIPDTKPMDAHTDSAYNNYQEIMFWFSATTWN